MLHLGKDYHSRKIIRVQRLKGLSVTSEVCSTDVVLKYPVNERILEVYVAVCCGCDPDRVIVYGVDNPKRIQKVKWLKKDLLTIKIDK